MPRERGLVLHLGRCPETCRKADHSWAIGASTRRGTLSRCIASATLFAGAEPVLALQVYEGQSELAEAREEMEVLRLKLEAAVQEAVEARQAAAQAQSALASALAAPPSSQEDSEGQTTDAARDVRRAAPSCTVCRWARPPPFFSEGFRSPSNVELVRLYKADTLPSSASTRPSLHGNRGTTD